MKPCPSYPGYSASSDGRVFSHRRRGQRIHGLRGGTRSVIDPSFRFELSQATTVKGYKTVSIVFSDGTARPVGVHQLVADAFHGPVGDGQQVRHLNGEPGNNQPSNLAYGTISDNANDRMAHGNYFQGDKHHGAKLTREQVLDILRQRQAGEKVKSLAGRFSVSVSTIESIIYGKAYKDVFVEFRRVEGRG